MLCMHNVFTKRLRKLSHKKTNTKSKRLRKNKIRSQNKRYLKGGGENYMEYLIENYSTLEKAQKQFNKIKYFYPLPPTKKVITFADVHGDLELLIKYLNKNK